MMAMQYVVGDDWSQPSITFGASKRAAINFAKKNTCPWTGPFKSLSVWEVDENGDAQGHWPVFMGDAGRVVRP